MRYIRLKKADLAPIDDWIIKSNQILDELKSEGNSQKRRIIIKQHSKHWRAPDLITFLNELSDGKCWYTEVRFAAEYKHIEHFRPKTCARDEEWGRVHDGYWWLAFDIGNYRLSKPMPNTRKGTYFPLKRRNRAVNEPGEALSIESPMFIDPTDETDIELLGFNRFGQVEPVKEPVVDLNEWDHKRIEFSIKRYGLNDAELCNLRKALWLAIEAQFNEYARSFRKYKVDECPESKGKIEQIRKQLMPYLEPQQEFSNLVRACFMSHPVGQILLKQCAVYAAA